MMEYPMLGAADVPRWDPKIVISDDVAPSTALDTYRHRAPARYRSPEITFSSPQPILVSGKSFAVLAEQSGIVRSSLYLNSDYQPAKLFHGVETKEIDCPLLVSANNAWTNYYHWTFQCLVPLMGADFLGTIPNQTVFLVPVLGEVQRASLKLAGIEETCICELPPDRIAVAKQGIYTNLTGGDFAFTPHPAIADAAARIRDRPERSKFAGRKVYVGRFDASNRSMINERELSSALAREGYATISAGKLSFAEQVALFRDAAEIVAPHGAALANILYAKDGAEGAKVVELIQENYLHQAFLKTAQLKRMRYISIVNRVSDRHPDPHSSSWQADIPLVLKTLAETG